MKPYLWGILLGATAATSACATPMTAGADFEPGVAFDVYTTFAWGEDEGLPTGDPRLDDNPFFNDRLHAAIQGQLGARGVRYDENAPDLLVHHHTAVRNHVEVFQADRTAGYTTSEYGDGTQVVEYEEGTFLVDVADANTKEIIWRGWALAKVDDALNDPEAMEEVLNRAVTLMFERYPVAPFTR